MAQERDYGACHDLGRCAPSPVPCAVRVLCGLVPVDDDHPLARAAQAKWCSRTSSCGSTCCRRSSGCRSSLRAASSRYLPEQRRLAQACAWGNPSGKLGAVQRIESRISCRVREGITSLFPLLSVREGNPSGKPLNYPHAQKVVEIMM
jgi:hypothetical protein